jgi:two-component system NtrC family sensor kinase
MNSTEDELNFNWELAVQAITVRVRWFGICVGYGLVNLIGGSETANRAALDAILLLGATYALLDTFYSYQGRVFLSQWPLFV